MVENVAFSHRICSKCLGESKSQRASKSLHWFKSDGNFGEWGDLTKWSSCIWKGRRSRVVFKGSGVAMDVLETEYGLKADLNTDLKIRTIKSMKANNNKKKKKEKKSKTPLSSAGFKNKIICSFEQTFIKNFV